MSAVTLFGIDELPPQERVCAAIKAFYSASSRETGLSVIRDLLAREDTHQSTLSALREGLTNINPEIAGTCAVTLSEIDDLPPQERVQAAFEALYRSSSRETALSVIRDLLEREDTRRITVSALRLGLSDKNPDISGICAVTLSEIDDLPPQERARSAIKAFYSARSREAALSVIWDLLEREDTHLITLSVIKEGLSDVDPNINDISAVTLPGIDEMPPQERADAAFKALRRAAFVKQH